MFKIAVAALPLIGAASSHFSNAKEHLVRGRVPKSKSLNRRGLTADVLDLSSSNVWYVSTGYYDADDCDAATSSKAFLTSGENTGFPSSCTEMDGMSIKGMCDDTLGPVLNWYNNTNCADDVIEYWSYDSFTAECVSSADYYGGNFGTFYSADTCQIGGNPWKQGGGLTSDMIIQGEDCPSCGIAVSYTNIHKGVCFQSEGVALKMSSCSESTGTVKGTTYTVLGCTGETDSLSEVVFDGDNCTNYDYYSADDFWEMYGAVSESAHCTGNAPGPCGSAMQSGVTFGLSALLAAVAVYVAKN
jgi:hypothetical protein